MVLDFFHKYGIEHLKQTSNCIGNDFGPGITMCIWEKKAWHSTSPKNNVPRDVYLRREVIMFLISALAGSEPRMSRARSSEFGASEDGMSCVGCHGVRTLGN